MISTKGPSSAASSQSLNHENANENRSNAPDVDIEEQKPFLREDDAADSGNGRATSGVSNPPSSKGTSSNVRLKSIIPTKQLVVEEQSGSPRGTVRKLLGLLVFIFSFALILILTAAKDSEQDAQCPGNLVLSECPCFQICDEASYGKNSDQVTKVCSSVNCQKGCACPTDLPFLIDANTCSAVCTGPAPIVIPEPVPGDFSDCPIKGSYVKVSESDAVLFQQPNTEVFHVRISPTYSCGGEEEMDMLLHFTLLIKGTTCQTQPEEYFVSYFSGPNKSFLRIQPQVVGCLDANTPEYDSSIRGAWFHYALRLKQVTPDSLVKYFIGLKLGKNAPTWKKAASRTFNTPLLPGQNNPDKPILVLGDTATSGVKVVAPAASKAAGKSGFSLAIHVGDGSYATNKGDCYEDKGLDPKNRCGYDCTGIDCHGADKVQHEEMLALYTWAKVVDDSLGGKVPWVSTMGNHDNDIGWFLTYRPPLAAAIPGVANALPFPELTWGFGESNWRFVNPEKSNAEKQASAMEIMKTPHFFSFDSGLMHVIEIGTEDNPINAYETWNGEPLSEAKKARWEKHYGKSSAQYIWLEQDLQRAVANREKVPWIMIYTHRPMYHTAEHHAWCSKGGDWYACLFVETYEPLLSKYGVNVFLTGHSHHYQRSYPMNKQVIAKDGKGTIHLIVGVGGYDVVGETWVRTPDWIASRQGSTLGYARFWVKNSTSIYWEHVAAESGKVLDSVWFKNAFV